MSPDPNPPTDMKELLSALQDISTNEAPVQEQAEQVSWLPLWVLIDINMEG